MQNTNVLRIGKFLLAVALVSIAAACSASPLEPKTYDDGPGECYLMNGHWICR